MHQHFHPPHIEVDKHVSESIAAARWVAAVNLWWAFRALREAGQNE